MRSLGAALLLAALAGCTTGDLSGDGGFAADGGVSDGGSGGKCQPGCGGLTPKCNAANHCVGCLADGDCPFGAICQISGDTKATCVPGCTDAARCGGGAKMCCGGRCVDTASDGANCGGCGTSCAAPHSSGACQGGQCAAGSCAAGWGDCDGSPKNGCETNLHIDAANCTSCGMACQLPHAIAACADGCYLAACQFGWDDCDASAANGCEAPVLSDPGNCGGCGKPCTSLPNASASCVNGVCALGKCNAGFADCDGDPKNGCEVNLNQDGNNCSQCGKVCPQNAPSCGNGVCGVGADYGPMHTFAGLTTDHYITQGSCSVNGAQNNDVDAAYFCTHFYGQRLGKTCTPKQGYLIAKTPNLTYPKMHKNGGCTTQGTDIPNTTCDMGACKIGNWSENTSGLVNLVCHCS